MTVQANENTEVVFLQYGRMIHMLRKIDRIRFWRGWKGNRAPRLSGTLVYSMMKQLNTAGQFADRGWKK